MKLYEIIEHDVERQLSAILDIKRDNKQYRKLNDNNKSSVDRNIQILKYIKDYMNGKKYTPVMIDLIRGYLVENPFNKTSFIVNDDFFGGKRKQRVRRTRSKKSKRTTRR